MSGSGINAKGEDINWVELESNINNDDPALHHLMLEIESIKISSVYTHRDNNNISLSLSSYIQNFNKFLKKKKISFTFDEIEIKKEISKKLSKKDQIILEQTNKKLVENISLFIESLEIIDHIPSPKKNLIESFFNIIYWALYLIKNESNVDIKRSIYMDCEISLYKAIQDSENLLNEGIIEKSRHILFRLHEIILLKGDMPSLLKMIDFNCYWDNQKPTPIKLYDEQKNVISMITNSLNNNESSLVFYKVPPANGKTILALGIAKIVSHINDTKKSDISYINKTLLYVCPNSIVRKEVIQHCLNNNVNLKFWIARTKMDKFTGHINTILRPHKSCYPDWGKKLPKKKGAEEAEFQRRRFSEDINEQFELFLNETRYNKYKNVDIKNYDKADNFPEIIVSDMDSAYTLLKERPDNFVLYFDEAFAAADLMITTQIMSTLPRVSVLVSATLAESTEIPSIISNFSVRHEQIDTSFIKVVKSNKQHIGCTFIGPDGNIFFPHELLSNIDELREFINLLVDEPLIQRGYSPEVVFAMSFVIDDDLPTNSKFVSRFPYFGMLSHETIREYGIDILRYVLDNDSQPLLVKIKNHNIRKMIDISVENMLTKNGIFYHLNNTLHIASATNFNQHVENISRPFLEDSPNISVVISNYTDRHEKISNMITELEKKNRTVEVDTETDINNLEASLLNLKLEWPSEFLLNSAVHAKKNKNSSLMTVSPNITKFGEIEDLNQLDNTRAKLFFSSIGVYQPDRFSDADMNLFLRNKDNFKFILSTPHIIYGTNIKLTIIDLDSSFSEESTKNLLYQSIGRAGRRGKSSSAIIILRNQSMINKILMREEINNEALNIERNYLVYRDEYNAELSAALIKSNVELDKLKAINKKEFAKAVLKAEEIVDVLSVIDETTMAKYKGLTRQLSKEIDIAKALSKPLKK